MKRVLIFTAGYGEGHNAAARGLAAALTEAIAASLSDITKQRGEVQLVPPGSLHKDGKVIEDARKYD